MACFINQLSGHEFEHTPRDSRGEVPSMLQSMQPQKVVYNLATDQQQQINQTF